VGVWHQDVAASGAAAARLHGFSPYLHLVEKYGAVDFGLASRPQDYAWSSDRYYRARKPPEWLDVEQVLPLLGPTRRIAAARYQKLMGDQVEASYEDIRSYAKAVKGDKAFADRVLREAGKSPVVRRLTEATVASAVAAELGLRLRDLLSAGRQRAASRAPGISRRIRAGLLAGFRSPAWRGISAATNRPCSRCVPR
jgi:hypothetical protein